jgi:opacity protein-like surface antigen
MSRVSVRMLALCVTLVCVAVPASAQSTPKAEISAGYQFLNFSVEGENESMPKGWYFDVAGNLNPMFAIVFQVGGNYKTFEESVSFGGATASTTVDLKVHEFLGGVRLNARTGAGVTPFVQVLGGGLNGSVEVTATTTIPGQPPFSINDSDSGTDFALEIGGGVNFPLSDAVGLRVGADYLRIFEEDAGANLFRFTVGIVFGR